VPYQSANEQIQNSPINSNLVSFTGNYIEYS
jgi:hypothetical protein